MSNNSQYPFPDEWAPPKKKESMEYGLQAAKAIYFSTNRYGYRLFNDTSSFNALVELAQGRQSSDNIYRMLGFYQDRGLTNDDNGSLAYIDVQVLNLITKYVNRAVAKLQRYKYDVSFTAVDPLSVDEQKQRSAQIKTLYELKDWFTKLKVDPQQMFPELEVNQLPEYPDELMFNLSANSKIRKIVDAEKTMKLVNGTINDMDQVMREIDWDLTVIGRGHAHCYLDENGIPRTKRINPKFWGGSYVENENFTNQEYAFFIDFITRNQFKTEAQGLLTQAEMDEAIAAHAYPNTAASFGTLPQYYDNYDGLEYIPVMRYYFLSNDNVAYKIWDNKETGNRMMDMTHYDYKPTQASTKDQKIVQNSFTSVYGGTWIVDSELVYNHRRVNMPRTALVNSRLPIITFAPNMKEGRIVSVVAQLEEMAFMLNVAWNRMKDILAKGRMGVIELNLTAIENIALGKGGKQWTEREAVDFFLQSNIWATRQNTNQYGQNIGNSLKESSAGLTITDYLQTITTCIKMMDEITGSSVVESATLPDRLTTGNMEAQLAAGSDAIEYLINGRQQIFKQVCHMNMLLTQQAKLNKVHIQGMIPALGTSTTEFFEVPDEIAYCDYGLQMQPSPGQEEWNQFFMELMEAQKEGRVNASDAAFIRQVKDLTLARYVLATREKINEAKNQKMAQQQQQFQMQSADQANQLRLQTEMQLLEKKKQDEQENMLIQARIDEALLQRKATFDAEINKMADAMKATIAKQSGIDTVLKEAMRSKSNDYKSDKQHEAKVLDAQTKLATAALQAASKKKEKAEAK